MNRLSAGLLLLVCVTPGCRSELKRPADSAPKPRTIAVTFDDLPTISVLPQTPESRQRLTTDLLAGLAAHQVTVTGFVNEDKLGEWGFADSQRVGLLRSWVAAGHDLGNHTWSHVSLHQVSLEQYLQEIVQGDVITRTVLESVGRTPRYFRHPFLHTGRDSATRDSVQHFLAEHGYTVAPVTIDNSDYIFAAAFDRLAAAGDTVAADSILSIYVGYLMQNVVYYEKESMELLGREPAQILLLHANRLNGLAFGALATALAAHGYTFITLDSALTDSAYRRPDTFYGSGGISWVQRWALTDGKKGVFFDGEPEAPDWVQDAAKP